MPAPGEPPEAPLPAFERATLRNGLEVLLARRTAVPIVRLGLLLDAGFAADQPARPGLSSMVMDMLDEGTRTRSVLQIAETLGGLGAEFEAGSQLDVSTARISALKDRLDPALELYADLVLNPTFPEPDFARVKGQVLARIEQEKVDPFGLALRVVPRLLYGSGHAYAQPLTGSGTQESVAAMTRDDLVRFHQAWFKPNHAKIVAVGDVTLSELTTTLEQAFAGWAKGEVPAKNIGPVDGPKAPQLYLLDRPGAEQSIIIVGTIITPKANPDEFAYMTFNDAFGGSFSGRVNMNLREDKHWSYGAGSFAIDARGQRPWLMFAPVQTDKTRESVQELLKELRDVSGPRPLSSSELDDAKARMTRTLAGRWETGSSIGRAIEEIVTFALPENYYATYAANVRAVMADAVRDTTGRLLSPDRIVVVVVGDRAKVRGGPEALGLGDPRLVDGDGQVGAR